MSDLWSEVHDLFDTNDGSLPDIIVEPLTGAEVSVIYNWVRSKSDIYSHEWIPTFWDLVEQRDIPIISVDNPAILVVNGRAEQFRHALAEVVSCGVVIPQLTIAVRPNSIEFDYRMGEEWGPSQLNGLFEFLWNVQLLAPNATIIHEHEGSLEPTPAFSNAWNKFKSQKSVT